MALPGDPVYSGLCMCRTMVKLTAIALVPILRVTHADDDFRKEWVENLTIGTVQRMNFIPYMEGIVFAQNLLCGANLYLGRRRRGDLNIGDAVATSSAASFAQPHAQCGLSSTLTTPLVRSKQSGSNRPIVERLPAEDWMELVYRRLEYIHKDFWELSGFEHLNYPATNSEATLIMEGDSLNTDSLKIRFSLFYQFLFVMEALVQRNLTALLYRQPQKVATARYVFTLHFTLKAHKIFEEAQDQEREKGSTGCHWLYYARNWTRVPVHFVDVDGSVVCIEYSHHEMYQTLSSPEGGIGLGGYITEEVRFVIMPEFQFQKDRKAFSTGRNINTQCLPRLVSPPTGTGMDVGVPSHHGSLLQEHPNLEDDIVHFDWMQTKELAIVFCWRENLFADEPMSLSFSLPLYRRSYERTPISHFRLVWWKLFLPDPYGKPTTDRHHLEQHSVVTGLPRYVHGNNFEKVMHLLNWIAMLTTSFTLLQRRNCNSKSTTTLGGGELHCNLTFATQAHAHGKPIKRIPRSLIHSWFWIVGVYAWACVAPHSMACGINSTSNLSTFECLEYDSTRSMFELTCSFDWSQGSHDCIVLQKDEVFEGNGHEINITGHSNWEGLFKIADSTNNRGPSSLADAPVIRNVHIRGGETSDETGFVVQSEQKHFIVESCSSTGVIQGDRGGGICGRRCSGDIRIANCWSSGEIRGYGAGGIAGRRVGLNGDGNTVKISHCYSTGDIVGTRSGGICGQHAGRTNGHVTITHSYSRGKIDGSESGGICGHRTGRGNGVVTVTYSYSTGSIVGSLSGGICGGRAGYFSGEVTVAQCYSLGEISGPSSGGIIGAHAARRNGHVSITNCYSRGHITGSDHAGGICGAWTGSQSSGENGGTVVLTNVYASGDVIHDDAGGLIGEIDNAAENVTITMSVYNGSKGDMIGGLKNADTDEQNSGNLTDIIGSVYCYETDEQHTKECWDNETVWQRWTMISPFYRIFENNLLYHRVQHRQNLVVTPLVRETRPQLNYHLQQYQLKRLN